MRTFCCAYDTVDLQEMFSVINKKTRVIKRKKYFTQLASAILIMCALRITAREKVQLPWLLEC